MAADKPTVFVLHDDAAGQDSLAQLLQVMKLPAEFFSTVSGFLDVYDPSRPGCLPLDIRLRGNAFELLKTLADSESSLPVIVITGHDDSQRISEFSLEKRLIHKDGSVIWINLTVSPIWNSGETPKQHIVIVEDITAQRQMEEQIQQHREELTHVSRMNTMGQMASGLSHELQQPLAAISMFAETCLMLNSTAGDDAELSPILEKIRDQSVRAGQIIRRLRNFVHKEPPRSEPVPVPEVIDDVLTMLESELRHEGVAVDVQLPDDLPAVRGDTIQLEQVVLNLVQNAAEAMREDPSDRREIVLRASTSELRTVEITVRDTGPGMSEEAVSQVFDPFFTTKSEGMGMGLPICRRIIEAHGGEISVSRNADRGLTFRIALPEACEESRNDI